MIATTDLQEYVDVILSMMGTSRPMEMRDFSTTDKLRIIEMATELYGKDLMARLVQYSKPPNVALRPETRYGRPVDRE